jgi:hypothetical protein
VKLFLRVLATTMAPLITPVAAIVAGKINIKLRVRVVHVWTVSEFNNPNEDNSIHMLLLDDKVGFLKLYNVVYILKIIFGSGCFIFHLCLTYKNSLERYKHLLKFIMN